jgi:hypothetical protein
VQAFKKVESDFLFLASFGNYPIHFLGCPIIDSSSDTPVLNATAIQSLDELDSLDIEKVRNNPIMQGNYSLPPPGSRSYRKGSLCNGKEYWFPPNISLSIWRNSDGEPSQIVPTSLLTGLFTCWESKQFCLYTQINWNIEEGGQNTFRLISSVYRD